MNAVARLDIVCKSNGKAVSGSLQNVVVVKDVRSDLFVLKACN